MNCPQCSHPMRRFATKTGHTPWYCRNGKCAATGGPQSVARALNAQARREQHAQAQRVAMVQRVNARTEPEAKIRVEDAATEHADFQRGVRERWEIERAAKRARGEYLAPASRMALQHEQRAARRNRPPLELRIYERYMRRQA